MKVERYTWSDALVDAQTQGRIGNGPLLLAMKLARVINWNKKELRWSDRDAWTACGSSKGSFYDNVKVLFDEGFFVRTNGNLVPCIPQWAEQSESRTGKSPEVGLKSQSEIAKKSGSRTNESESRTSESGSRTQESESCDTYSEDLYSEDSSSEDVSTVEEVPVVVADAPTTVEIKKDQEDSSNLLESLPLPHGASTPQASLGSEDTGESESRTHWLAVLEEHVTVKRQYNDAMRQPTDDELGYAATLLANPVYECFSTQHQRIESALVKAAVEKSEAW